MRALFRSLLVGLLFVSLFLLAPALVLRLRADTQDTGKCGGYDVTLPFTDVPGGSLFFCAIAAAFFTGLVNGTSATTYNPSGTVTRAQMAAFVSRTHDSSIRRASLRAAAEQWAVPRHPDVLNSTVVGADPQGICFDGEDIWTANDTGSSVTRVHASDGRFLGTWTSAINADAAVSAAGFIYVASRTSPGRIYRINPTLPAGAVTQVTDELGDYARGIAFDGNNLWTANEGLGPGLGSISRYSIPSDTVTTFGVGFDRPAGILYDGTSIWVVDRGAGTLLRVETGSGAVADSVPVGPVTSAVVKPVFDGTNIWVPVENAVKVVRASTPAVLVATLTGNGLGDNRAIAFDGERVLVTVGFQRSLSLWNASTLRPLGFLVLGAGRFPVGVASDGLHFWVAVNSSVSDFVLRY